MPHIHEKIDFTVSGYIVHSQKVLLVEHKLYGEKWLPIGGHIELDEDPKEALYREIYEESGISRTKVILYVQTPNLFCEGFKSLPVPSFLNIHDTSETHQHINFVYILESKTSKVQLQQAEHHKIKWFTRKELESKDYRFGNGVVFYSIKALDLVIK